jgi:hypothetical protein
MLAATIREATQGEYERVMGRNPSSFSRTGSNSTKISLSSGYDDADIYDTVRLTIGGRDCPTDVIEVPDDTPVLSARFPWKPWITSLIFVPGANSRLGGM